MFYCQQKQQQRVVPIKLLIQSEMSCSGYFSCDCLYNVLNLVSHLYVDTFLLCRNSIRDTQT